MRTYSHDRHDLRRRCLLVALAALCALSMRLYLQRVVIPFQVFDAAAHGRPRGNLSDLYPRWLGARELLLHGRDPYAEDITREIQAGYYGRPLDPARLDDPKDEQRFAYPVYVAFLLSPTVLLPFPWVQSGFYWFLLAATVASVPILLRVLRWPSPLWMQCAFVLLTVGSPAVMQGLKLRQLSLFVAALIFGAAWLLAHNRLAPAGVLLAFATIKPQLVWLLLLWLAVWMVSDFRRRYRLGVSFLITMLLLVVGSEFLLPHWLPRFWDAILAYPRYTGAASVLDKMISPWVGLPIAILSVAMTLLIGWRERLFPVSSPTFFSTFFLVLAVSVLVAPTFAPYNQILLLPSLLLLARDSCALPSRGVIGRSLLTLLLVAVGWPWLSSFLIAVASFVLAPQLVQRFWTVPFWSVWLIPVATVALMLVVTGRESRSAPETGNA